MAGSRVFSFDLHMTREGWALMTVETGVYGDSKTTNERGPCLVGSWGLSCQYKKSLSCLGCSSRPVQNMFFLTVHYINTFVPIAQPAGQAVVLGRQSLSMCLRSALLNWSVGHFCYHVLKGHHHKIFEEHDLCFDFDKLKSRTCSLQS